MIWPRMITGATSRFQDKNFERNLGIVRTIEKLAQAKGVKPGQLALAWVLAQGDDMVPIPGTKRRAYLEENVAAVHIAVSQEDGEQWAAAGSTGKSAWH